MEPTGSPDHLLLVDARALPEVYERVLKAKRLLVSGKVASASEAARLAGISRSAFYKYRDCVFPGSADNENSINLSVSLSDKAGVFSAMTTVLYENGANLITVNQGKPVDGIAAVSLTIDARHMRISADNMLELLKKTDGVISVRTV